MNPGKTQLNFLLSQQPGQEAGLSQQQGPGAEWRLGARVSEAGTGAGTEAGTGARPEGGAGAGVCGEGRGVGGEGAAQPGAARLWVGQDGARFIRWAGLNLFEYVLICFNPRGCLAWALFDLVLPHPHTDGAPSTTPSCQRPLPTAPDRVFSHPVARSHSPSRPVGLQVVRAAGEQ